MALVSLVAFRPLSLPGSFSSPGLCPVVFSVTAVWVVFESQIFQGSVAIL